MAIITPFQAGFCTHPGCIAVQGSGWRICEFPAQTFLLEANGHYWLWDTGYAHHFTDATRHGIFKLYAKTTPVYFESHEAIVAQLLDRGIHTNDLQGLIISHFHGDHIAGLKDFPLTPFICSGQGWQKLKRLTGFSAVIKGFVPDLIPSSFETNVQFIESFEIQNLPAELIPLTQAYTLPKSNGEILLIELPGHAAGHLGALIQTDKGWHLLASDAAWSKKNYQDDRFPSKLTHLIMDNPQSFYHTLALLKTLDQQGIPIILSHEVDLI